MSKYVLCVNNQTLFADDGADDFAPHLVIGKVYKVALPQENDGDMLRIIDGSGEDYLYPATYFEPFIPGSRESTDSLTIYLDPFLKGVLYAEAVASQKSMSALVKEWIDEHLDLPLGAD